MRKGTINKTKIKRLYPSQPIAEFFDPVIFVDNNGFDVYPGDAVEFFLPGEIFPTSGHVNTLHGIPRIYCFCVVSNQWNYYEIED